MTRGGYREGSGRKSSWNHPETQLIRVPRIFAALLLHIARRLDQGETLDTIAIADFSSTDFSSADFSSTDFSSTDFSSADFSSADFSSTDFSNTDYSSTAPLSNASRANASRANASRANASPEASDTDSVTESYPQDTLNRIAQEIISDESIVAATIPTQTSARRVLMAFIDRLLSS